MSEHDMRCDVCGKAAEELTQRVDFPGVMRDGKYTSAWVCDSCNGGGEPPGETYVVRFVHKISPRDTDTTSVALPDGAFADRKTLGAALRAAGVLCAGERIGSFRVEGPRVVAFPVGTIWHSLIITREGA